jgi:hypothetical protein
MLRAEDRGLGYRADMGNSRNKQVQEAEVLSVQLGIDGMISISYD